jgi:NAD(P)H-hydrate repair Nnr-like enzyme with NAD(P)H-hydrate dehydratase domain
VIGSGTDAAHRGEREEAELRRILAGTAPVVVDAGALDLAQDATAPLVLTPHAGELAALRERLGLEPRADLDGDDRRIAEAEETASAVGAVVLSKGARTVIAAPGAESIVVGDSPAWLSTAGTGDVLAGILGAMIAANPERPLARTAAAAAWLHAAAAARASGARDGAVGHPIVAMDVAEALPATIAELIA